MTFSWGLGLMTTLSNVLKGKDKIITVEKTEVKKEPSQREIQIGNCFFSINAKN